MELDDDISSISSIHFLDDSIQFDGDVSDLSTIGEECYLEPFYFYDTRTITYDEEHSFFHFDEEEMELNNLNHFEYFV